MEARWRQSPDPGIEFLQDHLVHPPVRGIRFEQYVRYVCFSEAGLHGVTFSMQNSIQQQLADFSLRIRQSSLKRFHAIPEGKENWKITPESMSIGDLAQHVLDSDNWLFRKIQEPELRPIEGNPGTVTITGRAQYVDLLKNLEE